MKWVIVVLAVLTGCSAPAFSQAAFTGDAGGASVALHGGGDGGSTGNGYAGSGGNGSVAGGTGSGGTAGASSHDAGAHDAASDATHGTVDAAPEAAPQDAGVHDATSEPVDPFANCHRSQIDSLTVCGPTGETSWVCNGAMPAGCRSSGFACCICCQHS